MMSLFFVVSSLAYIVCVVEIGLFEGGITKQRVDIGVGIEAVLQLLH